MKIKYKYEPKKTYVLTLKTELRGDQVEAFLELIRNHQPILIPDETKKWVEEKYETK